MPTITAIPWDRLLDTNPSPPPSKSSPPPPPTYRISPALYAADTSDGAEADSPFILNRKRRRDPPAAPVVQDLTVDVGADEGGAEVEVEEVTVEVDEEGAVAVEVEEGVGEEVEEGVGEEVDDDFFEPRDAMSVASSSDGEGWGSLRSLRTPFSGHSQGEFYDATADFSDGSASNSSSTFNKSKEIELRALRLNLLEEIEKRKSAEEALIHMQDQWQRMAKSLHQVGFPFPEIQHSENMPQIDPIALCQEIVATKFVMEAVERGIARAETETFMEEIVETKNHEISRLRDRLQYYEAMNHEMSQRNQEVIETARQQRLKRRKVQRWIWGVVGLSITIGAGLLAHSYMSQSSSDSSTTSSAESADAASITMESGSCDAPQTE